MKNIVSTTRTAHSGDRRHRDLPLLPASAAKMHAAGCSSDSIAKAEATVDAMPDTDANKQMGYKEMTDANEALVSGKMGECAMHLNKVMHMMPAKPAS